jgi:glycosyltransferase involved in cell wall biosynthesis
VTAPRRGHELGLPARGGLIVYVGRLEATKGVLDLIDAFSQLARTRDDVTLALVGSGSADDACSAAKARLGARLVLPGARPLEEVPLWMAASDCVTLPSWAEGTPNVILEALACGRRVVATAVGGIPDLVTGAALGELVPPRDPDALARALGRAADTVYDPIAVAALGARGGWDESAVRLLSVLEQAREAGQERRRAA